MAVGEAERFGGLEIDRQLEFGRCLHRQVCGLGAPENLVHLLGRVAKLIIPSRDHRIPSHRLLRTQQEHKCRASDTVAPKR